MTPDEHATAVVGGPAPATARSLTLEQVSVTYPSGTRALRDVSLSIAPGEMVSVVGLSGSGKSTLIRTINGLVPATSGRVLVGEQEVGGLSGRGLRELRGGIGMIFQGFNLAERTSYERVGRFAHSPAWRTLLGLASTQDTRIVSEALDSVGMMERAWSRAGALSGGQKQRVAIARALAQQPSVMLADEPVASLDPPTAHSVMGDLLRINRERGLTVLINLHLMDLARQYTTRMIGLRDGELVFDGPAAGATDTDFETIYGRSIQRRDVLGSAS